MPTLEDQVQAAYGVQEIWVDAQGNENHTNGECRSGLFPVMQWSDRGARSCPTCCPDPGTVPQQAPEAEYTRPSANVVPIPTTADDWTEPTPDRTEPAPAPHVQSAQDKIAAWLVATPDKLTVQDVTPGLQAAATDWASHYSGDFTFMVDMKAKAITALNTEGGRLNLSAAQAKGVLNCWRAELRGRK